MGFVPGLSLANSLAQATLDLTQHPFSGCVHLSTKMDSSSKDSGRLVISALLLPLPRSSWSVFRAAPSSLSGPPVVRQLMQVAVILPGWGERFQSMVP